MPQASKSTSDGGISGNGAAAAAVSPQKAPQKKTPRKKLSRKKGAGRKSKAVGTRGNVSHTEYPRHPVKKSLRIPRGILEQNAGHPCTDREAAKYSGIGYHGPFRVQLSSSLKFRFLERPEPGKVAVTELARQVLRPQSPADQTEGLRQAVLNAPLFGDVYKHYRGENLPDEPFFANTLADTYSISPDKIPEFKALFIESLDDALLLERHGSNGEKLRVLDVSQGEGIDVDSEGSIRKLGEAANVQAGDTCFVMMPFAEPIGSYFKKLFEPAIREVGLRAVRADDDMFGTGKIMEQIWFGLNSAKVLVAELTGRNPNVFYELGLAHALSKPVVLVAAGEGDVPFDLHHIRVIYYDMQDPFWGDKLIAKLKENILSAISNPQEAIFKPPAEPA